MRRCVCEFCDEGEAPGAEDFCAFCERHCAPLMDVDPRRCGLTYTGEDLYHVAHAARACAVLACWTAHRDQARRQALLLTESAALDVRYREMFLR